MDIERLQTDAEYWRNQDPSNGEATHFEACYAGHECAWVRLDRKGQRHYWLNGGWVNAEINADDIGPIESMIPRPTEKPKVMSDDCLAVKIGDVGNQIHNLACTYQNNEDLHQHLSNLACQLWNLAKEAPKQTVDGLPPIGNRVEFLHYTGSSVWDFGKVVGHDVEDGFYVTVIRSETARYFGVPKNSIRPIQTPEEKKRKELESMIRYWLDSGDDEEGIADAVLKWMENNNSKEN